MTFPFYRGLLIEYCKCLTDFFPAAVYTFDLVRKDNFIDQALLVKDEVTGREVLRYGGDFDDRPSDYEFSGNGIVFADRREKPAMQEVRYYYGMYI